MATTGTQVFPTTTSLADIGAYALNRVGIRRPMIQVDHLADVTMAANMVLSDLSTEQPNLWKIVQNSVSLVQGTTIYTLPSNVLLVTDAIIRTMVTGVPQDRVIYAVSKDDYLSYPNKTLQAPPTVYWQNRVVPIQLSLYQTPDGNGPYTLVYLAVQQDDDAAIGGAATLDLPYRFINAFKDMLVAELSLTYDKENAAMFGTVAMASKQRAQTQDREIVPLYIAPGLSRYWRT